MADNDTGTNDTPTDQLDTLEPIKQRFIDGTFAGTRGTDLFVYDELLRHGPLTASELADRLDIHVSTARRSLRRLDSDDLVEQTYRDTPPSKPRYQLTSDGG